MTGRALAVEIWCRIVDNYGDAAVCWRLARQLAHEHGARVVLRIDAPATLARLVPRFAPADADRVGRAGEARIEGVTIRGWARTPSLPGRDAREAPDVASEARDSGVVGDAHDPDVVVAAFACELPPWRRARMAPAGATPPPMWIDLEYLSAEPWVDGHHGLASIKPVDGAREWFYFPGFTEASGGLLRERGLLAERDRFVAAGEPAAWLAAHGIVRHRDDERVVSMFCYADAPLAALMRAMIAGPQPVTLLLAPGDTDAAVLATLGALPAAGAPIARGALRAHRLPWLAQDDYDRLLWSCDVNYVRGEDSWVRAHWAARPFVWLPYRQADGAHQVKLRAWLDRLLDGAAADDAARVRALSHAWSGDTPDAPRLPDATHLPDAPDAPAAPDVSAARRAPDAASTLADAWRAFVAAPPSAPYVRFGARLAAQDDLARRWMAFVRTRRLL